MNEQEYIQQRLDDQQVWYAGKSSWNQLWYKRLRIVEVVLAAGIPFMSSLMGKFPDSPNAVPVTISLMAFLIAATSALLAVYRSHENWLQYRTAAEQLKRAKFLYLTKSAPYDGDDPFHVLVENVERILGEENSTWREQSQSAAATDLIRQIRGQMQELGAVDTDKASEPAASTEGTPSPSSESSAN